MSSLRRILKGPGQPDRLALVLSLVAILVAYLVAERVFEQMPHIEDEMAYVWQAQAIAAGKLTLPSPPVSKSFLVPFVIDYNGHRFGKYPLGWPVLLALGIRLGHRSMVNPLLAGLAVWFTYRLGKRLFGPLVGLLAVILTLTSPFFLMNSGSLLSHPLGLVLSVVFALAWLEAFLQPGVRHRWLPASAAGAALGWLALTRPMTAISIALPFGLHGLYLLVRGDRTTRRYLTWTGLLALFIAALHFAWQYAVTGNPLLNPYTLWWEYDKVGFGPGVGRVEGGHTLYQAWINTRFSLFVGRHDLFGWAGFSWLFLPFGLLAILRQRNWNALIIALVFPSMLVIYLAYWIGSWLFGPRYYYESLFSLTLLSAAGIAFLAGWPTLPEQPVVSFTGWRSARPLGMTALLAILLCTSVIFYTPLRLESMHGLYGIQRANLAPFQTAEALQYSPALVFVDFEDQWTDYGNLLELQTPFLDTPFIFVVARNAVVDAELASNFPERKVYYYYPARHPFILFRQVAPSP